MSGGPSGRGDGGRRSRLFFIGAVAGVMTIVVGRAVIRESAFPDRLVAPLLTADTAGPAQAIVVLGAGVVGDCVPNLNGVRRVLHGARLWRADHASWLVFTGGPGDGGCPSAVAMAALAREIGVDAERIQVEGAARSTRDNATLTLPLLRKEGVARIRLVTDQLHMRRAAASFERLGLVVERSSVPIYEGHVDNLDMLRAAAREAVALSYYRARGWLGDPTHRAADATPTTADHGEQSR